MNRYRPSLSRFRNRKGMTAILVSVVLMILLGFAAMAVDVGYFMVTRNELQNIADATSLYGARWLGNHYEGITPAEQQSYVCDPAQIITGAQEVGLENYAGGLDGITIDAGDVRIGKWNSSLTPPFTETLNQPDAVSVIARREVGTNGPISSIFAKVFGFDTFDVNADATAALTGQGTTGEGDLELPVGISECFFLPPEEAAGCQDRGCNDFVQFSPANDPDSCAGWTSWEYGSNDITIRRILDEVDGYESPETAVGESAVNFIGGDLSTPTFDAMMHLYRRKGYDYDPVTDLPIRVDGEGKPVPGHLFPGEGEGTPVGDGIPVPLYDEDGVTRLEYPARTPPIDLENDPDPRFYDSLNLVPRNHHKWETMVVVYRSTDCANTNQTLDIVGYATILLTDVRGPPDKKLVGQIVCELISSEPNRGGGGDYGTKGSIPGLVE